MCYVGLCMCIGLRVVNIISGIPHPPPPPPPPRTHKKTLPAPLLEVVHEAEAGGGHYKKRRLAKRGRGGVKRIKGPRWQHISHIFQPCSFCKKTFFFISVREIKYMCLKPLNIRRFLPPFPSSPVDSKSTRVFSDPLPRVLPLEKKRIHVIGGGKGP